MSPDFTLVVVTTKERYMSQTTCADRSVMSGSIIEVCHWTLDDPEWGKPAVKEPDGRPIWGPRWDFVAERGTTGNPRSPLYQHRVSLVCLPCMDKWASWERIIDPTITRMAPPGSTGVNADTRVLIIVGYTQLLVFWVCLKHAMGKLHNNQLLLHKNSEMHL